jgi:K+-sensing histidine kinase KdpD
LVACALLALVRGAIDNTNAALILVLLVVAAASTGLRLAGLLAAASSAVWFDFFLTAPYGRFTINDRADIETTVLLILVGAAVTEICWRGVGREAHRGVPGRGRRDRG